MFEMELKIAKWPCLLYLLCDFAKIGARKLLRKGSILLTSLNIRGTVGSL